MRWFVGPGQTRPPDRRYVPGRTCAHRTSGASQSSVLSARVCGRAPIGCVVRTGHGETNKNVLNIIERRTGYLLELLAHTDTSHGTVIRVRVHVETVDCKRSTCKVQGTKVHADARCSWSARHAYARPRVAPSPTARLRLRLARRDVFVAPRSSGVWCVLGALLAGPLLGMATLLSRAPHTRHKSRAPHIHRRARAPPLR